MSTRPVSIRHLNLSVLDGKLEMVKLLVERGIGVRAQCSSAMHYVMPTGTITWFTTSRDLGNHADAAGWTPCTTPPSMTACAAGGRLSAGLQTAPPPPSPAAQPFPHPSHSSPPNFTHKRYTLLPLTHQLFRTSLHVNLSSECHPFLMALVIGLV